MEQLLLSLGINITSNAIYDFLKTTLSNGNNTKEQVIRQLAQHLKIENAQIAADTIINFAAQHGDIIINGSHIYASDSITMRSASGTSFSFGNNSVSQTEKTKIVAGHGARIVGTGNAQIRQNPDGSIDFLV